MSSTNFIVISAFAALICACESDVSTEGAYTGEWIQRNGERVCDGYMTRDESEEYCVADVPEDWQQFLFEGQAYYRQPLGYPADRDESE
jgi:hypothetical protein